MINQKRLDLLVSTAESMGLRPQVVTDYGLVSIKINGKERYIFHTLNNPNTRNANRLSQNKHATRVILERAGLPNIPYYLPSGPEDAAKFLSEHQRVVVKPVDGQGSKDIHLVSNQDELSRLDTQGFIVEKFIKGQEVRYLVVESNVKAVHYKMYETEINDPNIVQRIALDRSDWNADMTDMAIRATDALGLIYAAVDFLVAEDTVYILEVNSAPGIDRFQWPDKGPSVDIMRMYLELTVKNYT